MTRSDALNIIVQAIERATKEKVSSISEETDLIEEGIIDSLDSMTLLFEMDDVSQQNLDIDENYDDYKVSSLIDLLMKAN